MTDKQKKRTAEVTPNIAPGMHTEEQLDERATKQEIKDGDYTEVTQVIVDHTPED